MSESIAALADQCVMCGMCLPHCPTFQIDKSEACSPRGRIALAKRIDLNGLVDASATAALDSCLQCRRCETVCPADVRYGDIIERTMRSLPKRRIPTRLAWLRRAIRRPRLLAQAFAIASGAARLLPGRHARWLSQAQRPVALREASLSLFVGCVSMAFQATAQRAALAVAARIGIDLGVAALPCCGALDRHLGFDGPRHSRSMRLVALDSGCIDSLRDNGHHVDEWCAFLLDHASLWQIRCREKHERVALWVPCTHRRLGAGAVKALLARLGVTVVELDGVCCGAAGPNVLSHTSMADALAEPLLAQLRSLNVSALITTNVGCAMHLSERLRASGSRLPVRHPAELLLERLS